MSKPKQKIGSQKAHLKAFRQAGAVDPVLLARMAKLTEESILSGVSFERYKEESKRIVQEFITKEETESTHCRCCYCRSQASLAEQLGEVMALAFYRGVYG